MTTTYSDGTTVYIFFGKQTGEVYSYYSYNHFTNKMELVQGKLILKFT